MRLSGFAAHHRLVLISAFLFFGIHSSFSQTWLWAKQGAGASQGYAVSTDAAGNVFTAGYYTAPSITFDAFPLTNAGAKDIFVVKYDNTGTVLWAQQAGATGNDVATGVAADAGGNVYVTGYFSSPTISFGSVTLTNSGSNDIFLVKYDGLGNVLWAKNASGTSDDRGAAVSVNAGGDVVISGSFMSATINFGSGPLANAVPSGLSMDVFVARYNSSGNLIWARVAGDIYHDAACAVAMDGGGNVFVAGYFSITKISFGGVTLTNAGSYDVFIVKYDINGNVLWAKGAGDSDNEVAYSLSADPTGNVFMTGFFESFTIGFGPFLLTSTNGVLPADAFIVKYSSGGNVLWAKGAGGVHNDMGYSVSADGSGNAFVTGFFGSSSIAFGSTVLSFPNGTGSPVFIVKYSAGGQVICASHLTSGGHTNSGVGADAFGNAYVGAGFQSNPFIVGPVTLNLTGGIGATNAFVAKFTCNATILTAAATAVNPLCYGMCTGTATANAVNGTLPYTYAWTTTPVQTTATATGLCAGTYSVVVRDAVNASATAPVTIFEPPPFSLTTSVANVCGGSVSGTGTVVATGGTAPYTYNWSNGNTTTVSTGLSSGNYIITATDSKGCTSVDTAVIGTYPAPLAGIAGSTTICSGTTAVLTGSGGTSYSWSNGATTASVNTTTPSSYTLTVTDSNGCTDTASVNVSVLPVPVATASGGVTITQGDSAVLTATGGPGYLWSNGSSDSVITVKPSETQQYCVTVVNAYNCSSTACVTVIVEPIQCPEPYLPNAFSPNGDGENDSLQIYSENIECVQFLSIIIYDRWGEKVYQSADPQFRWDGTYTLAGFWTKEHTIVFSYYMFGALSTGEKFARRGNITLLK